MLLDPAMLAEGQRVQALRAQAQADALEDQLAWQASVKEAHQQRRKSGSSKQTASAGGSAPFVGQLAAVWGDSKPDHPLAATNGQSAPLPVAVWKGLQPAGAPAPLTLTVWNGQHSASAPAPLTVRNGQQPASAPTPLPLTVWKGHQAVGAPALESSAALEASHPQITAPAAGATKHTATRRHDNPLVIEFQTEAIAEFRLRPRTLGSGNGPR
ncbi:hypothetical protein T492DRAFT_876044 [Pavlovales sp. CCMP2436]|nr:hypothetical protein T492DRAFT_876044 [Pavlovales sp. CCMP2436]